MDGRMWGLRRDGVVEGGAGRGGGGTGIGRERFVVIGVLGGVFAYVGIRSLVTWDHDLRPRSSEKKTDHLSTGNPHSSSTR